LLVGIYDGITAFGLLAVRSADATFLDACFHGLICVEPLARIARLARINLSDVVATRPMKVVCISWDCALSIAAMGIGLHRCIIRARPFGSVADMVRLAHCHHEARINVQRSVYVDILGVKHGEIHPLRLHSGMCINR